jgi:hypothetical protein
LLGQKKYFLSFGRNCVSLQIEIKTIKIMCTFNISVDEGKLASNYPGVAKERFGQWLQKWVDDIMSGDAPVASRVSPNAHTYEEMKAAICERIDRIEAGKATFYTNDEVFSSIRERYGLL